MTEKIIWYSNGIQTWKDVWITTCEKFGTNSKQATDSLLSLKYYTELLTEELKKIK